MHIIVVILFSHKNMFDICLCGVNVTHPAMQQKLILQSFTAHELHVFSY